MIDVETLSTQPDAAILSVGVAIFDDTQVLEAESWAIADTYWHGHIEAGTVKWWNRQNEAARSFSFNGTSMDVSVALALKVLLEKHNPQETYANDPDFDLIILKQWWSRCMSGTAFPIPYWTYRSYRTLSALTKEITGIDPKKEWAGSFIAHNPAEDAVAQARVVIQCRRALRRLIGDSA
jgi:hypothetical protein